MVHQNVLFQTLHSVQRRRVGAWRCISIRCRAASFGGRLVVTVPVEDLVDGCPKVILGFAGRGSAEVFAEERLERLGEFADGAVVVVDEDSLEERLVELAAEL